MVKIIIIGAGISGLSSYLFLRKHLLDADSSSPSQHEIKIYEAYDIHRSKLLRSGNRTGTDPGTTSKPIKDDDNDDDDIAATEAAFTPQSIGGALGVMHNGLNVLSRLDSGDGTGGSSPSSVVAQMARRGHPVERWQMNAARGFKLGEICLAPKPQPRHSDTTADSASTAEPCVYPMIMIGRQACWEILRDHVLHTAPDANVVVRKVVDVVIGDEATLSRVQFQDGSEEEADLVIGADGLRSVLRRAMFRDFKPQPGLRDGDGDGRSTGWIKTLRGWLPSMGRDVDMDNRQTDYITPHYEYARTGALRADADNQQRPRRRGRIRAFVRPTVRRPPARDHDHCLWRQWVFRQWVLDIERFSVYLGDDWSRNRSRDRDKDRSRNRNRNSNRTIDGHLPSRPALRMVVDLFIRGPISF